MKHETFADLGVSEVVANELAGRGITAPFAIQKLVIADVLAGYDVLAQSPTGSGKTLAFGIPLVERLKDSDARPSALVLAPTRELALQIVEELRPTAHARALSIAAVYGGAGIVKQARLAARRSCTARTPGGGARYACTTPGLLVGLGCEQVRTSAFSRPGLADTASPASLGVRAGAGRKGWLAAKA